MLWELHLMNVIRIFVSWHKNLRTSSQNWIWIISRTSSHEYYENYASRMSWELRLVTKYCENYVSKLKRVYHENFASWMLWELRLLIEIGNISRTSSLDRIRNVVRISSRGRIRNVMRTASRDIMRNIVRTTSQVRIENIMRISSHNRIGMS